MGMGTELLVDPDVTRWHSNLGESAARGYLRWLSIYCSFRGKSPKEVIDEFKTDKKLGQDSIQDFLKSLENKEYAPKTLHSALFAIKSWLESWELEVTRKIKIENVDTTPTIANEEPPTSAELRDVLNHCDSMRTRCVVSLIAFTGMRFKTLAGLRLGDFPEMEAGKQIKILKEPMRINVRREISKNHKPYFAFLTHEGAQYLKSYLEKRAGEEDLTPQSSLFVADRTFKMRGRLVKKGDTLTSGALSMLVSRAMRLSGLTQRPYVWKSYCDLAMVNGRLPAELQHFLMGHKGTIEATYSTQKRLSDAQVDEFRVKFAESVEPLLSTAPRAEPTEQMRKKMLIDVLKLLGGLGVSPKVADILRQEIEKAPAGQAGTLMDKVLEKIKSLGPGATFTMEELFEGLTLPPLSAEEKAWGKGLGKRLAKNPRVKIIPSEKVRWRVSPELFEKFGANGEGNLYDVRVVSKIDKKVIVQLLEAGFSFVQDVGSDESAYRKKRE